MAWLLCFAFPANAKGPLQAPALRDGQYVYTIPADFDPPLIGAAGIGQINEAAKGLHYPYYVVLSAKLPGTGNEDERAAKAVDGLAEDWATASSSYDVGTSSVFLLAFDPRKYRFVAGGRWKNELGFEQAAHEPYTRLFVRSVSRTPKDPKGGIIAMMKAVDDYLWSQTDPVQVAARAEAARVEAERKAAARKAAAAAEAAAEAARKMQTARGDLDTQTLRLEDLLAQTQDLPSDVTSYRDLLSKAKAARSRDDLAEMQEFTRSMKPNVDVLNEAVGKSQTARAVMLATHALELVVVLGIILGAVLFVRARRAKYRGLVAAWTEAENTWNERVTAASGRYVDFYSEREDLEVLRSQGEETKALYDRVTGEVDAIYLLVNAMKSRVARLGLKARTATVRNQQPLEEAIDELGQEFPFVTNELNADDLFGPPTKEIKVDPNTFAASLSGRFKTSQDGWAKLKEAARTARSHADELFPHAKLDVLVALCQANNIPERWLSDHPLIGDDASDRVVYDALDASRKADAIAFARKVKALLAKEADIEKRVARLVAAVALARSARPASAPTTSGTVVDAKDDPVVTFESARTEEDKLNGRLASRETVEEIEEQAQRVRDLYAKSAEQEHTLKSAAANSSSAISGAEAALGNLDVRRTEAERRGQQAVREHAAARSGTFIENGDRFRADGQRELADAKRLRGENRHLDARRAGDRAATAFNKADGEYLGAIKHCNALDAQKTEFEATVARMNSVRDNHVRKIRQYDGSIGRLGAFQAPNYDRGGPVDYALLMSAVTAQQRAWEAEEHRAQRDWEDEQARIREIARRAEEERQAELRRQAEERRRQQEEDDDRRRRQQEDDDRSRSSSSGGDWGGGGSSSSGGSWDGGGSSSSGGSW